MKYQNVVEGVEPVVGVDWFDFSNPANVVVALGVFVPVVTAVITKKVASSEVKAVSTVLLSALLATAGTLVGLDGGWDWRGFGNAFLSVFIPAIATYYGYWKHSALTRVVTDATENFGVLIQSKTVENDTRPDGPTPGDAVDLAAVAAVDEPVDAVDETVEEQEGGPGVVYTSLEDVPESQRVDLGEFLLGGDQYTGRHRS